MDIEDLPLCYESKGGREGERREEEGVRKSESLRLEDLEAFLLVAQLSIDDVLSLPFNTLSLLFALSFGGDGGGFGSKGEGREREWGSGERGVGGVGIEYSREIWMMKELSQNARSVLSHPLSSLSLTSPLPFFPITSHPPSSSLPPSPSVPPWLSCSGR